jgi:hypothetical protein
MNSRSRARCYAAPPPSKETADARDRHPAQVQAAFEAVKDDPSFDESRGLWERGQPPVEMIQAMCLRPEILRAFAGFGGASIRAGCSSGGSRSS